MEVVEIILKKYMMFITKLINIIFIHHLLAKDFDVHIS